MLRKPYSFMKKCLLIRCVHAALSLVLGNCSMKRASGLWNKKIVSSLNVIPLKFYFASIFFPHPKSCTDTTHLDIPSSPSLYPPPRSLPLLLSLSISLFLSQTHTFFIPPLLFYTSRNFLIGLISP